MTDEEARKRRAQELLEEIERLQRGEPPAEPEEPGGKSLREQINERMEEAEEEER